MTPFDPIHTKCFDNVFTYPHLKLYKYVQQFRVLIRLVYLFFFILLKGRKYSCIHIQYVLIDFFAFSLLFRTMRIQPIVTVFGSDLVKISGTRKRLLRGFLRNIKLITFANPELRDEICTFYGIDPGLSRICRFGLSPLDLIKTLRPQGQEALRTDIGLPEDKIIICVGNNFNSNQQHLAILSALAGNQTLQIFSDKLHFVFPLTYGNEIKYKEVIMETLRHFPFSHTIYSEYLDERANACLRLSCDIMIQLQKKDQLSGAMQEHLFAGNIVITGGWLPYKVFRDRGIYFREIRGVTEIGDDLVFCLNNLTSEKQKCSENSDQIYAMSGWGNTISDWIELYDEGPVNNLSPQ